MADFTLRYADWKGGDYGERDPAKADADTFDGINVYSYGSGLLGVRAGIKALPVTGLPTHPVAPGPLGLWAYGNQLMIVLGRPYVFPMVGGAATAWAPWPTAPASTVHFARGNGIPYSLENFGLYKHVSPTVTTAISTPTPLSYFTRWGYFFVGIDASRPWRIWHSTVDASGSQFDVWGANNFLDIDNTDPITALVPIYNTLYVGKRTGWWAVSGVLGTLATTRDAVLGNGPISPNLTVVSTDNRLVYWANEPSPAWFNGERVRIDSDQRVAGGLDASFPADGAIVTPTGQRVVLAHRVGAETGVYSWADSAWTRHRFPAPLGGLAPGDVRDGADMPTDVVYGVLAPATVGDPAVVVSYSHQLDRPGHVTDQYAAPSDVGSADLVAGNARFPSYWEPIGRQVRVRSVIVQFRKWASGVPSSANEIHLRINAHGKYGGGVEQGRIHHWVEPCERASTDGTDDSWRVNLGEQGVGNGFQLEFTKLVGVALREVIVLCDARTERV